MAAYYNEIDPVAAEWLRRLIARGLIAPGEVDERDIRDVAPAELLRFTQCHFFAGIGIWSGALRRAGWPDDRPIWTGSCPCQPFSAAGAGKGFTDERHLWPHWHWLIEQCRPDIVLGEQVAGKDGLGWNDLVSADLDGIGYASGAVVTSAAGFGMEWRGSAEARRLERAVLLCPDPMVARHMASFADWADQALGVGGFHIRERQYFIGLANPDGQRLGGVGDNRSGEIASACQGASLKRSTGLRPTGAVASDGVADADGEQWPQGLQQVQTRPAKRLGGFGEPFGLGHADDAGSQEHGRSGKLHLRESDGTNQGRQHINSSLSRGMADSDGGHTAEEREQRGGQQRRGSSHDGDGGDGGARLGDHPHGGVGASANHNRRGDLDWLFCRDGEWRPVGPGAFPLAHANPGRVGRLRAYGNGLDFEQATGFVEAVIEILIDLGR